MGGGTGQAMARHAIKTKNAVKIQRFMRRCDANRAHTCETLLNLGADESCRVFLRRALQARGNKHLMKQAIVAAFAARPVPILPPPREPARPRREKLRRRRQRREKASNPKLDKVSPSGQGLRLKAFPRNPPPSRRSTWQRFPTGSSSPTSRGTSLLGYAPPHELPGPTGSPLNVRRTA